MWNHLIKTFFLESQLHILFQYFPNQRTNIVSIILNFVNSILVSNFEYYLVWGGGVCGKLAGLNVFQLKKFKHWIYNNYPKPTIGQ